MSEHDYPTSSSNPEGEGKPGKEPKRRLFPLLFNLLLIVGGLLIFVYLYPELFQGTNEAGKDAGQGESPMMSEAKPGGERKVLYWVDPMNPSHKSDKPGKAPDGMDLVPVYADEGAKPAELPEGSVAITSTRQQMVGVQYGVVSEGPLVKKIVAVGTLASNETKISHIHTKIDGWIEKTYVDFVGMLVKKGDPLLSIYSPELVSTQQELLLAKKGKDYLGESGFGDISKNSLSLYQSTRQRLRLWDISEAQIREIEKRGTPERTMTLYSPIDGFVTMRNAFAGLRVTPDTELYSIVDLSVIWVLADIYEYELPVVQVGQKAVMRLTYYPGETFQGKVTYIYPELNKETRTLKIRLEFPNPDFKLKPDMYVNVELEKDLGVRVSVPTEAVLDSGMEQLVFVAREDGYFEPRKVGIGPRLGDRIIIESGLKPGEKIVTSANFMVDSESKLKAATGAMAGHAHGGGVPAGGEEKASEPAKPQAPGPVDHSQHQ